MAHAESALHDHAFAAYHLLTTLFSYSLSQADRTPRYALRPPPFAFGVASRRPRCFSSPKLTGNSLQANSSPRVYMTPFYPLAHMTTLKQDTFIRPVPVVAATLCCPTLHIDIMLLKSPVLECWITLPFSQIMFTAYFLHHVPPCSPEAKGCR